MDWDRTARRLASAAVPVGAVAICLLLIVPTLPGALAAPPPLGHAGPEAAMAPLSAGKCPGAAASNTYGGVLVDVPSSGPSVAGQDVVLSYQYEVDFLPTGGGSYWSCVPDSVAQDTNSTGGFALDLTIPTNTCAGKLGCDNYTGPFGPIRFSMGVGSELTGGFLTWTIAGGVVDLSRVAALTGVSLDPSGSILRSEDQPIKITAHPVAGNGQPSPANMSYSWEVTASGWDVLGSWTSSVLTIEGLAEAEATTVEMWANGTYNGSSVHLPEVTVDLSALPTLLDTASVNPTAVDVGAPTTFHLSGTGAAGYAYNISVYPGLLLPEIGAPCVSTNLTTNLSVGLVRLSCTAVVVYERTGTATPSASLSNGYWYAYWSAPGINVSRPLSLVLTPDQVYSYVGAPVHFHGAVAAGTGTAPFDSACLTSGDGGIVCNGLPATSWNFTYAYAHAGNCEAALTVVDSGGGNDTVLVPVTIYGAPNLTRLSLAANPVIVYTPFDASATITGGALPLEYWWNLSKPASTIRGGTLLSDGTLELEALPTMTGPTNLTLTIVDALGTRLSEETQLNVVPDTAASIGVVGPPNATAVAGSPVAFSFDALNLIEGRVAAYAGPVTIRVHGVGPSDIWVNSSVGGPIPISLNGTAQAPGSLWRGGYLNFTVTDTVEGVIDVSIEPSVGVGGPPMVPVAVGPDELHLVLLDPHYTHPGSRSNSTEYQIQDRFGNALSSGSVVVRSVFGSTVTVVDSPIRLVGGVSFVWVNFSASGSGSGTIYVLSSSGEPLLPLIAVPAASSSTSDLVLPLLIALAALAVGVVALGLYYRRRRPSAPRESSEAPSVDESAAVEEELKRLAEGRAHVLAHTPTDRPADLDEIAAGWSDGPPPDMAELSEWIGGLVSEGLLVARVGPDGKPRFVRTEPPIRSASPRVELDAGALEEALSRRTQDEAPEGEPTPGSPEAPD